MTELSEEDERIVRALFAVIQEFRELDSDMQMPMAATFLLVALNDDISRTEVMHTLDVAGSTATRNLMGLMEAGRLGRPGHALIDQRVNPNERRWRMHSMTPKGREVLSRLIGHVKRAMQDDGGRPEPRRRGPD